VARVSGRSDDDRHLARIGQAIRTIRKQKGLSQEALADAAGIDRSHMGKIERGERNVTLLNLWKIAVALDLKTFALIQEADL
jgi:transcriptional regulator with XRE-family HTH domain